MLADSERQLRRISDAMAADPATTKTFPDFRGFVGTLIARADRSPLRAVRDDGSAMRITGFDLRFLLAAMIGRRGEIERLPMLFGPAIGGDYAPLADAIARDVRRGDISAMGAVMDCASSMSPARRRRVAAEAPATLLGTTPDFPLPDWCSAWDVPALPNAFRAPIASNVPVLFIAGDLDGQTPPANAIAVRRGFRNGRVFTIHRAGHDPSLFLSSPELFDAITRFIGGADTTDRHFTAPPLRFGSPLRRMTK